MARKRTRSTNKNQYGLTRNIPDDIARAVRQDCGFACVICGSLGMHYDHFAPEFTNCKEHNPDGIALLCPTCHQDKTSGRLSSEKVALAKIEAKMKWKDPSWRSQFTGNVVRLRIGTNTLEGAVVGLSFGSHEFLRIEAGNHPLESWAMTGTFIHGAGEIARFEKNRVVACSGNWDVELEGQLLTFRQALRHIVLQLALLPDVLAIERLDFKWPSGFQITIDSKGDVMLDNLRNNRLGNFGRHWKFSNNRIVGSGFISNKNNSAIRLKGRSDGFSMNGCEVITSNGVIDFNSLANIEDFLSPDILKF